MTPIDADDFVAKLEPALQAQDWDSLMSTLKCNWTADQVLSLLSSDHQDARKIAALAVGLIGQSCCLPELSRKLQDADRVVVEMAEHAMWQIWFRGGTCDEANKHCARGAEALNCEDIDRAITHLEKAIRLSPDFAEAYNQRAIAHYLAERYEESIKDCLRVIELMPLHFGALGGLGHAYVAIGEIAKALHFYERALQVNPHLECIAELVQELRGEMGQDACSR